MAKGYGDDFDPANSITIVNEENQKQFPLDIEQEKNDLVADVLNYNNSELVQNFLKQIQTLDEKKAIVDFIESKFPIFYNKESFDEYEALSNFLCKLPLENPEKGCDILRYFLEEAPTPEHKAYGLLNIVQPAATNPQAYVSLESTLKNIIEETRDFIREYLDEFFIWQEDMVNSQKYLRENLQFTPLNETPPLISENINDISPIINAIFKKVYTDLTGEDRDQLVTLLGRDLSTLIKHSTLNFVLEHAPLADIYIYKTVGGGGYTKSSVQKKPFICLCGAEDYIKGKNLNLPTNLAHESTHLLLDHAFNNNQKPFSPTDKKGEAKWESLKELLMPCLKSLVTENPNLMELMYSVDKGYVELNLTTYREKEIFAELPAFALQEVAIRELIPNILREAIISKELDIIGFLKEVQDQYLSLTGEVNSEEVV